MEMFVAAARSGGNIRVRKLFDGCSGQDGALYGDCLFRFDHRGACTVYSASGGEKQAEFVLARADELCPHSNAVSFGAEKWTAEDEFPLLYTNIYNNYASAADRMEGVCCVYRIVRAGSGFSSELVQVIRIGFVDELSLWKSRPGKGDVRPYGNFVVDVPKGKLFALTMRDEDQVTRCFAFDVPSVRAGMPDEQLGVPVLTLTEADIRAQFDFPYSHFMQGACSRDGVICSLEGFDAASPDDENLPVLRIVDTDRQEQIARIDLFALGLHSEPELVDFMDGALFYMDGCGQAFELSFD